MFGMFGVDLGFEFWFYSENNGFNYNVDLLNVLVTRKMRTTVTKNIYIFSMASFFFNYYILVLDFLLNF